MSNFKAIPNASSKLLNLTEEHPSKNIVFLVKSFKIEVMITSLIEMLELPKFGQYNMGHLIAFCWKSHGQEF